MLEQILCYIHVLRKVQMSGPESLKPLCLNRTEEQDPPTPMVTLACKYVNVSASTFRGVSSPLLLQGMYTLDERNRHFCRIIDPLESESIHYVIY